MRVNSHFILFLTIIDTISIYFLVQINTTAKSMTNLKEWRYKNDMGIRRFTLMIRLRLNLGKKSCTCGTLTILLEESNKQMKHIL